MAKRVLIIDDEEILVKTFSRLLQKQGYEALTAVCSEEAFAVAGSRDFDLILSDIRMPGKDGVQIVGEVQEMRHRAGKPRVPLIFITGYADAVLENAAKRLDPVTVLYKPFDALKLMELIRTHMPS